MNQLGPLMSTSVINYSAGSFYGKLRGTKVKKVNAKCKAF